MEGNNVFAELAACKNIKFLGIWKDPEGVYPEMPMFEMSDEPAEVWNQRARGGEEMTEHEMMEMYLEFLDDFQTGKFVPVCQPSEICKASEVYACHGLNALAYGYQQGRKEVLLEK